MAENSYTPVYAEEILAFIFQKPSIFLTERHNRTLHPLVFNQTISNVDPNAWKAQANAQSAWGWWTAALFQYLANTIAATALQHVRHELENHWMAPIDVGAMHKLREVFGVGLLARCEDEELLGMPRLEALHQLQGNLGSIQDNQPAQAIMPANNVQTPMEEPKEPTAPTSTTNTEPTNEVQALREKIERQKKELNDLHRCLKAAKKATPPITTTNKAGSSADSKVIEQRKELARLNQKMHQQALEMTEQRKKIAEQENQLFDQQRLLDDAGHSESSRARLKVQSQELGKLDQKTIEQEKKVTEQEHIIAEQRTAITRLINKVEECDQVKSELQEQITAKDTEISRLREELEASVAAKDAEIRLSQELETQVADNEEELSLLREELAEAREALKSALTAVTTSPVLDASGTAETKKRGRDLDGDEERPDVKRQRKSTWLLDEWW